MAPIRSFLVLVTLLTACSSGTTTPPGDTPSTDVDGGNTGGDAPDGGSTPTDDSGPVDPCLHDLSRTSVMTEVRIGNQGSIDPATQLPNDACCFDFTGDGQVDNKLGQIFRSMGQLAGMDVNGLYADAIASGSVLKMVSVEGLDDLVNDGAVQVSLLDGKDADADLTNNLVGLGSFEVLASSFGQDGRAVSRFANGSVTSGQLVAGPSTVRLSLPLLGTMVELELSEARLEGPILLGPDGKGLAIGSASGEGAKLGGVVRRRDVAQALNAAARKCSCLQYADGKDAISITSNSTLKCETPAKDDCTAQDGAFCDSFGSFCAVTLGLFASDVDLDGDGAKSSIDDGVSLGVRLKATSATVQKIEGCP